MKVFQSFKSSVLAGVSVFLCLILILGAAGLKAAQYEFYTLTPGSGLTTLSNSTATSVASTPLDIPANVDIIIMVSAYAANTTTAGVTSHFNLTLDRTNYSTTLPLSSGLLLNGTATNTSWTVVMRTNITGAQRLRWDQSNSPATTNVVIDKVMVGWFR